MKMQYTERMKRSRPWLRVLAVVSVCLLVSFAAEARKKKKQEKPRGDISPEWSDRAEWQKPDVVMRVLGVKAGDPVADIGAGTGYFTRWLSAMVGARGTVLAVDIEQTMLDHIEDLEDIQYDNIRTVLADPDDPKLPEGELELVLIVNTWRHIDHRRRYLPRLARALRNSGRLAIIGWHEGELPVGPPTGSKLPRETVLAELDRAGWILDAESVALPYQYFLIFYPPRDP